MAQNVRYQFFRRKENKKNEPSNGAELCKAVSVSLNKLKLIIWRALMTHFSIEKKSQEDWDFIA